jgi:hypothetical protein
MRRLTHLPTPRPGAGRLYVHHAARGIDAVTETTGANVHSGSAGRGVETRARPTGSGWAEAAVISGRDGASAEQKFWDW